MDFPVTITCTLQGSSVTQGNPVTFTAKTFAVQLYIHYHFILFYSSSDHQENDLISAPVIENPEHQTMWYSKYFLGKFHHNYVGQDSEKSTYVLSVVEEKSFGKLIPM